MIFNQSVGCLAGIAKCFPKRTVVDHMFLQNDSRTIIDYSFLLDYSLYRDYNDVNCTKGDLRDGRWA